MDHAGRGPRAGREHEQAAEPGTKGLPTNRLHKVLKWAKQESGRESAQLVGTDHLLLGLLLEGESHVAQALDVGGASYRRLREVVDQLAPEV